jgi:hypothetical protein
MTQRFTLVLNAFMAGAYDTTSQASEAKCREIAIRTYANDPTMQEHIYEQQLVAKNSMAEVTKSRPAPITPVKAFPPWTPAQTRPVEAKPAKSYLSQELSGRDVAGLLLGAVGMMGLIVLLAFVHTKIAPENPAKQRERKISEQFSPFNGSHIDLSSLIKSGMNDPKSYEHVSTSYIDKGDCILVRTTFRGKNAFGGVVTNSVTAEVNEDGKIIRVVSSSP